MVLSMASPNDGSQDDSILQAILNDPEDDYDFLHDPNEMEIEVEAAPMELESEENGVEEGEIAEDTPDGNRLSSCANGNFPVTTDQNTGISPTNGKSINQRQSCKKKKNAKRKNGGNFNISKFVYNTCRRLKEPKTKLVWNAVNVLGVEVMINFIKEVDAIEKCGGQMTVDGKRRRTPGGVLWNIMKTRINPDVYKSIMVSELEHKKRKCKKKAKLEIKMENCEVSMEKDIPLAKKHSVCLKSQVLSKSEPFLHKESISVNQDGSINKLLELDQVTTPGVMQGWQKAWEKAAVQTQVDSGYESLHSSNESTMNNDKELSNGVTTVGNGLVNDMLKHPSANDIDFKRDDEDCIDGDIEKSEVGDRSVKSRLRMQVSYHDLIESDAS